MQFNKKKKDSKENNILEFYGMVFFFTLFAIFPLFMSVAIVLV